MFSNIKGDRVIWGIIAALAIFSFLPVYSASSNLAYLGTGTGNTTKYVVKHAFHLGLGFLILYTVHKVPYRYFQALSRLALPVILLLLVITMFQGNVTESGTNENRWITIPVVGLTFQTSALASVILLTYVARYLNKIKDKKVGFKESILPLWLWVFLIVGAILPANFSTAAIIFALVLILCFIGGYPIKYLAGIIGAGVLVLAFFIMFAKAFPGVLPNRVDTWGSRVENFFDNKDTAEDYQIERAKIAIAKGGVFGLGSGKSTQKYFLPQSSSDFIYAIVVEEYGLTGGVGVLIVYLLLLFRLVIVATKADTLFGKLLVIGVGLPVVFQAMINMGVATELFPVTGQTLPLISSGGTSIWMTCLALGMVLSVSARREVIREQEKETTDNPLEILSEAI